MTMTPKTVGALSKFSYLMNLQSTPDVEQLISADFVDYLDDAIDTATVHAQWAAIRTYSYVQPRPPEPMTRWRLLRHNAIEAWKTMRKTGWRRCPPPLRLIVREKRVEGNPLHALTSPYAFAELHASADL